MVLRVSDLCVFHVCFMCVLFPYSGVNDYRTGHDLCDGCRVLHCDLLVVVRHFQIIVVQSSGLYNLMISTYGIQVMG
jgi:hypothetical protein